MTGLSLRRGSLVRDKSIRFFTIGTLIVLLTLLGSISHYIAHASSLTAPTLVSPSDNTVTRGESYTQSWGSVSGAIKYRYESYNNASATSLRASIVYTSTSKLSSGVSDGSVYWWRVRAIDSSGNEGAWSPIWKLSVDNTAPVGSLTVTADRTQNGYFSGAVNIRSDVTAQEKNIASHSYSITDPYGNTNQSSVSTSSNTNTTVLDTSSGDGMYQVKYIATDLAGNASAPVAASIRVDNTPPNPPTLTGVSVRYIQPGTVTRSWNASSSTDVAKYTYKSFYSESDARSNPDGAPARSLTDFATGKTEYTHSSQTGPEERTFWYRVAAVDAAGNKTWSQEVHRVTIDSTAPAAPTLSVGSITSGGLTKDTGVTATWNVPSGDTASYEYRYRADTDVDWQVSAVTDTQWAQALAHDTTYHMQVRAIDLAGNASEWSPEFVLTRDATPPTVSVAAGAWSASTTQPVVVVTGETDAVAYLWHAPPEVQMTSETVAEPQFTVPTGVSGAYALTLTVTDAAGNQTTVPFDISYTYFVPVQRVDPVIPVQDTAPQPTQPSGQQLDSGAAASGSTSNVAYDDAVPASVQISPSVAVVQATRDIRAAGAAAAGKQDTDSRDPAPAAVGGEVSDQAGNGTRDIRAVKGTSTWNIFGFGVFWLGLVCALVLAIAGIWWLLVARRRARQSDRVPTED